MIQLKQFLSKLDFKTATIIVLVAVLLLTRMCSSSAPTANTIVKVDGKKYEQVQHRIDTVVVAKNTVVYRPGRVIYKQPLPPTTPPTNINKDSIVKQYYGATVYKDTVKLKDNQGYVSVTDTVSQNKIIGRRWSAHVQTQTIKETTVVKELPRNQIYVGGMLGGDKTDPINYIGPAILLKTKQDRIYTISVGYGDNGTLSIQGGLFWKIKLRK